MIELWSALAGAVFGAGGFYVWTRMRMAKHEADINGLGRKVRADESRTERRWKHMIATAIETSTSLDEAKQHARLLREDAWRD